MVNRMKIISGEASKLIEDFENAAMLFGEIQQKHTLYLQQNQFADVQKWSDERSQAMGQLQQALSAVWGCDSLKADTRIGRSLQRRIGVIVEREKLLAENVKSCQEQTKSELGKMRKGKKAIGGYGTTGHTRRTGLCFRNSL